MRYLVLLLCTSCVAASTSYSNYCKIHLKPFESGSDMVYNCKDFGKTSVIYETCCSGKSFNGFDQFDVDQGKTPQFDCSGDEVDKVDKDLCAKKAKFCEWKDDKCDDNPCGKQDSKTECLENEFDGKTCKWTAHSEHEYCSSASSITLGLSSLIVLALSLV